MQKKKQGSSSSPPSSGKSPKMQTFQQFFTRLKDHVHNHQVMNNMCSNFNKQLSQMSRWEIKNISKGRYKNEYKKIKLVLESDNDEVKLSCMKQILYKNCEEKFKQFASCRYKVILSRNSSQQVDKKEDKKCQRQINEYVGCVQKLSKNIILSSTNIY